MEKFETLIVPDSERLSDVQKLCDIANPFLNGQEYDDLFMSSLRQIMLWHYEKSDFYKRLLDYNKIDINSMQKIKDLIRIPFLHANFFKTHVVKSISDEDITTTFTSSGTTGQTSQMFFDDWSIKAGRRMVDFTYDYFGFYSESPTNYLISNYEPLAGSVHGATNTSKFLSKYAPAKNIFFTLRHNGTGKHEFDIYGCIRALQEYAEEGLPVRFIGFPSFIYFILERMKDLGMKNLQLNSNSLALFAGGWKGYADKQIPKNELYIRMSEQLGIPEKNCRDAFGSVEHSVPYSECENHHKHIPVWSRMFIRDVKTTNIVDYGTPGFSNFIATYLTSVPNVSVMMGDLCCMYPAEECGCGIKTPFFEIIGRAGTSKSKSCAISAAELLKKEAV